MARKVKNRHRSFKFDEKTHSAIEARAEELAAQTKLEPNFSGALRDLVRIGTAGKTKADKGGWASGYGDGARASLRDLIALLGVCAQALESGVPVARIREAVTALIDSDE